jgi:hypothetical protein
VQVPLLEPVGADHLSVVSSLLRSSQGGLRPQEQSLRQPRRAKVLDSSVYQALDSSVRCTPPFAGVIEESRCPVMR